MRKDLVSLRKKFRPWRTVAALPCWERTPLQTLPNFLWQIVSFQDNFLYPPPHFSGNFVRRLVLSVCKVPGKLLQIYSIVIIFLGGIKQLSNVHTAFFRSKAVLEMNRLHGWNHSRRTQISWGTQSSIVGTFFESVSFNNMERRPLLLRVPRVECPTFSIILEKKLRTWC